MLLCKIKLEIDAMWTNIAWWKVDYAFIFMLVLKTIFYSLLFIPAFILDIILFPLELIAFKKYKEGIKQELLEEE